MSFLIQKISDIYFNYKRLNEKYLQQRIEELEYSYNKSVEHNEKEEAALFMSKLIELKQLLANCEEVEVEEIKSAQNKFYEDEDGDTYWQDIVFDWLVHQGYKLIKTK